MPTYSFRNKETLEEFDKFLKMSERETYLEENPEIEQIHRKTASLIDPMNAGLGKARPDAGFRDVLKKIKSHHKINNINDF
jgi:hypothetical protein